MLACEGTVIVQSWAWKKNSFFFLHVTGDRLKIYILDGKQRSAPVSTIRWREVIGAEDLVLRPSLLHFENIMIEDVAQRRILLKHHRNGHLQKPQSRGCDYLALPAK